MRLLIASVILAALASPAFAACQPMRPSDWGDETAAQVAYAACLATELQRKAIADQQLAQLKADYELKLTLLEQQQRIEAAPIVLPPTVPIWPSELTVYPSPPLRRRHVTPRRGLACTVLGTASVRTPSAASSGASWAGRVAYAFPSSRTPYISSTVFVAFQ